ncbi:hypothetical protein WDW37_06735 [Bdellovibrionota bacterium FG-1]
MRTTEIKVNGEKREAQLAAGGQGFKIYTVFGLEGWALVLGRKTAFIDDKTPVAQVVADYVNLRYHALDKHELIKARFHDVVDELVRNQDN